MSTNYYFPTPIFSEYRPEYVKSLNKASNKFINQAKKNEKKYINEYGDFGRSFHSTPLTKENDFIDFRNYVGNRSVQFLNDMGYDMSAYETAFTELWVQEFAKKGWSSFSTHTLEPTRIRFLLFKM